MAHELPYHLRLSGRAGEALASALGLAREGARWRRGATVERPHAAERAVGEISPRLARYLGATRVVRLPALTSAPELRRALSARGLEAPAALVAFEERFGGLVREDSAACPWPSLQL